VSISAISLLYFLQTVRKFKAEFLALDIHFP
jgi:hypothetical protein